MRLLPVPSLALACGRRGFENEAFEAAASVGFQIGRSIAGFRNSGQRLLNSEVRAVSWANTDIAGRSRDWSSSPESRFFDFLDALDLLRCWTSRIFP